MKEEKLLVKLKTYVDVFPYGFLRQEKAYIFLAYHPSLKCLLEMLLADEGFGRKSFGHSFLHTTVFSEKGTFDVMCVLFVSMGSALLSLESQID